MIDFAGNEFQTSSTENYLYAAIDFSCDDRRNRLALTGDILSWQPNAASGLAGNAPCW